MRERTSDSALVPGNVSRPSQQKTEVDWGERRKKKKEKKNRRKKRQTMEYRRCFRRGNKIRFIITIIIIITTRAAILKTGQQEPGPEQYCVLAVYRIKSGSAGSFPAEMLTELRKTNRTGKTMDCRRLFGQHKHAVHPNKSLNLIERLNRNILILFFFFASFLGVSKFKY